MIHYKYVSNRLKNHTSDINFRVFEDDDVFVSQMFEKTENGMNENYCKIYINHKDGYYPTGTFDIPTRPMDKLLFDGLNSATDRVPKLVYRNDSDSMETFNSGSLEGITVAFSVELYPGASVMKKDSGYINRYLVFKQNVLIDDNKIDIVQGKKYPRLLNLIDYELKEATLFNLGDSFNESDIEEGKFKLIEDTDCFEVYPNFFRFENFGLFRYDYDKYGVNKIYKHIIDPDTGKSIGLKPYFHSFSISDKISTPLTELNGSSVIRTRIRNICYHPVLITKHGIEYHGKGKGFIETLEMTIIGGKISEIEQVFEEITEKEFLLELEKEKKKVWKPKN